ncbi:TetR/AcrR family transcriptional regulator [Pyxidicoccus fallax]|uniref:TetR/AcrR family transcriptional regulator n=1 Tax=Pyxidicoccus fallax TaxID=394095 RepID=A0A848L470_9BACT|nr:TetR/AcrR family transcriptional regulator [Pyxidicoccus fallax]NMO13504.1 TetR/AcrR family transcriptional regulator [Pyxidicoccus fallax]NPC78545.1 TetR/AcrR family transcriptional regulator [Pyxidicoccus fallax]
MPIASRKLSTAEERRSTVLRTAIQAFAARGYYGTTTVEVAKAAGISQAYLYRLFPDKEELFVAVIDHCAALLRDNMVDAVAKARSREPEAVLDAMRTAYAQLIDSDRDLLRVLMHANCAASEPPIREAIRTCYAKQVEYVRSASGASDDRIRSLVADGLLTNVLVAVGADEVDAPWTRTLLAGRHPT